MICRWRPKFTFSCSNLPPFIALHLLALTNSPHGSTNLQRLSHIKPETTNLGKNPNWTIPKLAVVTPQAVLTTLNNCSSDIIALSFFIWCAKQPQYFHDKSAFHHMVSVLSNLTHRHGTVKAIVGELEAIGCARKAQTLLLLMRIYWHGAMYNMVFESFKEMCNYGYVPNTYVRNILMDALFKMECVDDAMMVLEETQVPNFLSFNIAICNLSRLNDAYRVKIVLRRMLRRGCYMNPNTYTLVLDLLSKSGRLEEALQLLGMMIVLGLPVSVNSWSALINGFSKLGKIDFAAYLLEKMEKTGCSPNVVTYTPLIKGFLEHQKLGKVYEMIIAMESKGCLPDLILCNVLMDCLSKMGWHKEALEIFSRLGELRLKPDAYTSSSLVPIIYLSRQHVELRFLISMLIRQLDLVVFNYLSSYSRKDGYPEGAVEFYNSMLDRGIFPDKYSFSGVLRALCQLRRTREAVNVYHRILCSFADVDVHVHTVIINGLIKSGQLRQAMKVFTDAENGKFPLDVVMYSVAISGLIRAGEMKSAHDLFNRMKEVNIMPDERVYNLMLYGFCKSRDIKMVYSIRQEMADRDIKIDCRTYRWLNNLFVGSVRVSRDALDIGTSSSEDFLDSVAAVG